MYIASYLKKSQRLVISETWIYRIAIQSDQLFSAVLKEFPALQVCHAVLQPNTIFLFCICLF